MKITVFIGIFHLAILYSINADSLRLDTYDYPFPVQIFKFASQKQDLEMAYMEVCPVSDEAESVVLLHGKNFSGAYWEQTAVALRNAGYHVIMPDQIGFGKSSKPENYASSTFVLLRQNYQFSLQQLASNTHELLRHCAVKKAHILGHSMGGMMALRYALMFPENTTTLILVDPLGLEDWQAKGVPYTTVYRAYQTELQQNQGTIKAYEQDNYFHGQWNPAYDNALEMLTLF